MLIFPLIRELIKCRMLWLIPLIFLCIAVHGQTYASTHRVIKIMDLEDVDYETAKQLAVKQAVQSVLLQQGGRIDAVTLVENGVLKNKQLTMAHQGILRSATVLSENRQQNQLTLDIEVTLHNAQQQCHSSAHSINIVTSDMPFLQIQDAQDNQMHGLIQYIPRRFAQLSQQQDSALKITKIVPEPWYQGLSAQARDTIQLGLEHDASYIIVGQIDDASTKREFPTEYAFWKKPSAKRHLALRFHVYDTFTGELVFDRGYQFTATWPFPLGQSVNIHTRRFTESQYAQHIHTLLLQVQQDITQQLTCRPKRARIVAIDRQQLVINLGQNQGITAATKFALVQHKQQLSGQGNNLIISQPTDTYFNTVRTQPNISVITPEETFVSHNIQLNDWVELIE